MGFKIPGIGIFFVGLGIPMKKPTQVLTQGNIDCFQNICSNFLYYILEEDLEKWLKANLFPQGSLVDPANFETLPRPLVVVYHPQLDFVKRKSESKRIRKALFELREELENKINIAVSPYYPELEEKTQEDHYNGKNVMFPIEHDFDVDKSQAGLRMSQV